MMMMMIGGRIMPTFLIVFYLHSFKITCANSCIDCMLACVSQCPFPLFFISLAALSSGAPRSQW